MPPVVDHLVELFTWIGFGFAVVTGAVWLVLLLVDGTWLPVRGYVEDEEDGGRTVRWIDVDGVVHAAPLHPEDERRLGGADSVTVYSRRGDRDRMRLHPRSPATRLAGWLALGFGGLGVVCVALSVVFLFV